MTQIWNESARDEAYTSLCDAVTAAGRDNETLFLSRLCLLLMEELSDREAAKRAIAAAQIENVRVDERKPI